MKPGSRALGVALAGCLIVGCQRGSGPSPAPEQTENTRLDSTRPLVFVRTEGHGQSTHAVFRFKNTTDETLFYKSGMRRTEAWRDGKWSSQGSLCPTGAPTVSLAPGEETTMEIPWGEDGPPQRLGIDVWREKRKNPETIWSDAVPPLSK